MRKSIPEGSLGRRRAGGPARALLAACLLVTLAIFAWWRESEWFWWDGGPYPLWLRRVVKFGYYPLTAVVAALLADFSWRVRRAGTRRAARVLAASGWLCLAAILGYSSANNVENLLRGRPIHWHPWDP